VHGMSLKDCTDCLIHTCITRFKGYVIHQKTYKFPDSLLL